jgi:hypothetical protein
VWGVLGSNKIDVSSEDLPSLLHAATIVTKHANMPTAKNDSLIFVGGGEEKLHR